MPHVALKMKGVEMFESRVKEYTVVAYLELECSCWVVSVIKCSKSKEIRCIMYTLLLNSKMFYNEPAKRSLKMSFDYQYTKINAVTHVSWLIIQYNPWYWQQKMFSQWPV